MQRSRTVGASHASFVGWNGLRFVIHLVAINCRQSGRRFRKLSQGVGEQRGNKAARSLHESLEWRKVNTKTSRSAEHALNEFQLIPATTLGNFSVSVWSAGDCKSDSKVEDFFVCAERDQIAVNPEQLPSLSREVVEAKVLEGSCGAADPRRVERIQDEARREEDSTC